MKKLTREDLKKIKQTAGSGPKNWIKVGMSTCGIAAGALEVFNILKDEVKKRGIDLEVKRCGCAGVCSAEPLVEVRVAGMPTVFYGKVTKEVAAKIIEKHVLGGTLVNDHVYDLEIHEKAER